MKVKEMEKLAEEIINELDSIAREIDHYEYGLPMSNDQAMDQMKFAIVKALDKKKVK